MELLHLSLEILSLIACVTTIALTTSIYIYVKSL